MMGSRPSATSPSSTTASASFPLRPPSVQAWQNVRKGDLIGYMGQSGYVTGPHLHWEAIVHGVRVDARLFTLPGEEP